LIIIIIIIIISVLHLYADSVAWSQLKRQH